MSPQLSRRRALPAALTLSAVGAVAVAAAASSAQTQSGSTQQASLRPTVSHASSGRASSSAPAASPRSVRQSMVTGTGTIPVPAGFPSAATTGVPVGTTLRVIDGSLTLQRDGATLENALVNGCVRVSASHVTIRNVKIRCGAAKSALFVPAAFTGTRITHVEVDGLGKATVGISIKNAVVDAVNVHGSGDGVHLGSNAVLTNSYVHDLGQQVTLHHDVMQTMKDSDARHIRVQHDTLIGYAPTWSYNSVYHMGSSAVRDVTVTGSFLDGGHYTVQVDGGPQQRSILFQGNTFGRHYHYRILGTGTRDSKAVTFVGNVWAGTGAPATPDNSKGYGLAR